MKKKLNMHKEHNNHLHVNNEYNILSEGEMEATSGAASPSGFIAELTRRASDSNLFLPAQQPSLPRSLSAPPRLSSPRSPVSPASSVSYDEAVMARWSPTNMLDRVRGHK
jgi:hypothetical protein